FARLAMPIPIRLLFVTSPNRRRRDVLAAILTGTLTAGNLTAGAASPETTGAPRAGRDPGLRTGLQTEPNPPTEASRAASPADPTGWIPDEIDLIVTLQQAGRWWDRPALRSLTALAERRLSASELGRRWGELASSAGLEGGALAGLLFADELVLGLPVEPDGRGAPGWIASVRIDDAVRRDLLARLPLRPLGRGRYEVRGHDMVLVDRPPYVIAGSPALMGSLVDLPGLDREAGVDRPAVEIEIRRGLAAAPMRVTASVHEASISIEGLQHAGRGAAGSTLVLDAATSRVLRDLRQSHAAVVATVAGGPSPMGVEWIAVLPEIAVPPTLGGCVLERRIWTLGETAGGATDPLRAHPTPAIAAIFEVTDAEEGRRRLGAWAEGLAKAVDRRFEALSLPPIEVLQTIDGGTMPLAPIARVLFGGHALTARLRLDWSSASGPSGDWAIVGTGGTYLRDVRQAFEPLMPPPDLETRAPAPTAEDGDDWRLVQVGWIDAARVSDHLDHWCDRGLVLFEANRAARLRPGLERLLEGASAFERVQWSVEENASGARRFEIRLDPAPVP
ncbi:MAG: hypothetical protein ACYTFH_07545, partial [Planctomycetota bacterium]